MAIMFRTKGHMYVEGSSLAESMPKSETRYHSAKGLGTIGYEPGLKTDGTLEGNYTIGGLEQKLLETGSMTTRKMLGFRQKIGEFSMNPMLHAIRGVHLNYPRDGTEEIVLIRPTFDEGRLELNTRVVKGGSFGAYKI